MNPLKWIFTISHFTTRKNSVNTNLSQSQSAKRSVSIFSYPTVLIETGGELTWVCPDFGLYKAVKLPAGKKVGMATAAQIGFSWLALMRLLYKEIQRKKFSNKPLPNPSSTSHIFQNDQSIEKTMSPKQLAKKIGAGENTIRRAIDSGKIRGVTITYGGHRRIPETAATEYENDYITKKFTNNDPEL